MKHTFEYYGKIRGQGRPRVDFIRRTVYKNKSDKKFEEEIRAAYINSNGLWFGDKPIKMVVTTFRTLPKNTPKKNYSEMDTHKPDASNILKSVEDALNKIAYQDDKQIVSASCQKMPRTRCDEHMVIEIEDL